MEDTKPYKMLTEDEAKERRDKFLGIKKPDGLYKLMYGKEQIIHDKYHICLHVQKIKKREPQYQRQTFRIVPT